MLDIPMTGKATGKYDLPLAPRTRPWDASAAVQRVRRWAGGPGKESIVWPKYKQAFFWYDAQNSTVFASYKLPYADVLGGTLTAVPRGIFAAAAAIGGARGGVDISDSEITTVKSILAKWYAAMRKEFDDDSLVPPWERVGGEIAAARSAVDSFLDLTAEGRMLSKKNIEDLKWAIQMIADLIRRAEDRYYTLRQRKETQAMANPYVVLTDKGLELVTADSASDREACQALAKKYMQQMPEMSRIIRKMLSFALYRELSPSSFRNMLDGLNDMMVKPMDDVDMKKRMARMLEMVMDMA